MVINNNNKALCFVRIRWDEGSATKCSEDGNPPLMTSLAFRTQPTGTNLPGEHKGCNYRGETATQNLSDETSGSDDVAPSVHFRRILTIGITGIIIVRVMMMMMMIMPVVEVVEWWRFPWRFCDPACSVVYRGADKSLARPDLKKQFKGSHFSSDAEVIAVAETWLDGQHSELFLSGLQKLEFGRCSLFPSWSG